MKLGIFSWILIIFGIFSLSSGIFLYETRFFFFFTGLGILLIISPFIFSIIKSNYEAQEKEEMFLEFTRSLLESVKTGTPISRSIINARNRSFGILSPHVKKLANQIAIGIPFSVALDVFSKDVDNRVITRTLTLIGQAEKAGGDIGEILESATDSVNTSEKLKKERLAAISTLIVQGYIIFFVFMIIVLIMQFRILPMVSEVVTSGDFSSLGSFGFDGVSSEDFDLGSSFLLLILFQGFFCGLVIGKLSEGSVVSGIKHSFALIILSFLIFSIANIFFV